MIAKKYLGQNFLKSNIVAKKAIASADIKTTDKVLEIGPGKGILTKELLKKANQVIAVEKDNELIKVLNDKFANEIKSGKLKILNMDCLKLKTNEFFTNHNYKLIANIPYYITGAIIQKFLTENVQPEKMVLLVQKEVADRVTETKKESIISLSVKAYGEPKKIEKVPAKMFSPKPKVDSSLLLIDNMSKNFFKKSNLSEETFFQLIKSGFNPKRKLLINNLKNNLNKKQDWAKMFADCKLDPKSRAENLKLKDWKCLGLQLNN